MLGINYQVSSLFAFRVRKLNRGIPFTEPPESRPEHNPGGRTVALTRIKRSPPAAASKGRATALSARHFRCSECRDFELHRIRNRGTFPLAETRNDRRRPA